MKEGNTEIQRIPPEYFSAVIVRVEVHVKRIDVAIPLVCHDHGGSHSAVGFPVRVGSRALDPIGVFGYVVVGRQVDVVAELVYILQGQGLGGARDFGEGDARGGVVEEDL